MKATKTRELRPQAPSLRKRFLYAEVTEQEHQEIQRYCRNKGESVSQFIADLLLAEARKPKGKQNQKVILKPALALTPQQQDKLELLARLHKKKSVGEYILDVLEPELELKRLHVPVRTKLVRYYLSPEEYDLVAKHIATSGLSPSSYAAMVVLRVIRK